MSSKQGQRRFDLRTARSQIISRHYVFVQGFFHKDKMILSIVQDGFELSLFPIGANTKRRYKFDQLDSIEMSQQNARDLTIHLKNNGVIQLSCFSRTHLINELYKEEDIYLIKKNYQQTSKYKSMRVKQQIDSHNISEAYDIELTVYRTFIKIKYMEFNPQNIYMKSSVFVALPNKDDYNILKRRENLKYINFNDIGYIHKTSIGFDIEMRDSGLIYSFILSDLEITNNLLQDLAAKANTYLGIHVDIESQEFADPRTSCKRNSNLVPEFQYKFEAYKLLETKDYLKLITLINDESYIYECDQTLEIFYRSIPIDGIKDIVVYNEKYIGVKLVLKDKSTITYMLEESKRNSLISNIVLIRQMQEREKQIKSNLQFFGFIHRTTPDYEVEISGWPIEGPDIDFELDLMRDFSGSDKEEQFYEALRDFNVNATLETFFENEPIPFQILFQILRNLYEFYFSEYFQEYLELQMQNRTLSQPYKTQNEETKKQIFLIKNQLKEIQRITKENERRDNIIELIEENQDDITNPLLKREISHKLIQLSLQKIDEVLKGIIILIKNKSYYREFKSNKQARQMYLETLDLIIKASTSKDSIVAYLSGLFLQSFCRQSSSNERRYEIYHKQLLFESQYRYMEQTVNYLMSNSIVDNKQQTNVLQIHSIFEVYSALIYDRKESTPKNIIDQLVSVIDQPYFIQMLCYYNRYECSTLVYYSTLLLNTYLQNSGTLAIFKEKQSVILSFTSLFIRQLYISMTTYLQNQRKVSAIFLSQMLVDFASSCSLLCRIVPKSLFRLVATQSNDLSKWSLDNWEAFIVVLGSDYNTPSEQWNTQCKKELLTNLKEADDSFNQLAKSISHIDIMQWIQNNFQSGNKTKNYYGVRWNFEEFSIKYITLEGKFLVGKYYLEQLLEDNIEPKFTIQINQVNKFFSELKTRFLSTPDNLEQQKILKTIILLYTNYASSIRDLNTLQYWLRIIQDPDYSHVRLLIAQLIYASISTNEIFVARANMQKFMEGNGLSVLACVLCLSYRDLPDNDILTQQYSFEDTPIPRFSLKGRLGRKSQTMILQSEECFNYTNLESRFQVITERQSRDWTTLFIINIFKVMLSKFKHVDEVDRYVYPIPTVKSQIIEKFIFSSVLNLAFLKDQQIKQNLIELITNYFCDKYTYKFLLEHTAIFKILLSEIDEEFFVQIMSLFHLLYVRLEEDKDEINYVNMYCGWQYDEMSDNDKEKAVQQYPLLKYLPRNLIRYFIDQGVEETKKIFYIDKTETPLIIWNKNMREHFLSSIDKFVRKFKIRLRSFGLEHDIHRIEQIPLCQESLDEIISYTEIDQEIKCGPVFLRLWSSRNFKGFPIQEKYQQKFQQQLQSKFKNFIEQIQINEMTLDQLNKLNIISKSMSRSLIMFDNKGIRDINEVIGIALYTSEAYTRTEKTQDIYTSYSQNILQCTKIIERSLKSGQQNVFKQFQETQGIHKVIDILNNISQKFSREGDQLIIFESYMDRNVSISDLQSLYYLTNILLDYIKISQFNQNVDSVHKLMIFNLFQKIMKLSLNYLDFVRLEQKMYWESEDHIEKQLKKSEEFNDQISKSEEDDRIPDEYKDNFYMNLRLSSKLKQEWKSYLDYGENLLFSIGKNILDIILNLSQDNVLYILQTGVFWRTIQICQHFKINENSEKITPFTQKQRIINDLCKLSAHVLRKILLHVDSITSKSRFVIDFFENNDKITNNNNNKRQTDDDYIVYEEFQNYLVNVLPDRLISVITQFALHSPDQALLEFLIYITRDTYQPDLQWVQPMRVQLNKLLEESIQSLYTLEDCSSKIKFLEKIKKFEYSVYKSELYINGVFVKNFNREPTWKIYYPKDFVNKLFQFIKTLDISQLHNDKQLSNFRMSITAIKNVFQYHKEYVNLAEYLPQIANLPKYLNFNIDDDEFSNVKEEILSIIEILYHNKIESKLINTKETLFHLGKEIRKLKQQTPSEYADKLMKVIEYLYPRIGAQDQYLAEFILTTTLECVFNEHNLKIQTRKIMLDFYRKTKQYVDDVLKLECQNYFPFYLKHKMTLTLDSNDNLLEFIDSEILKPDFYWTNVMRDETYLSLRQYNFQFEAYLENRLLKNNNTGKLSKYAYPNYPELHNEVVIQDIFLRGGIEHPELVDTMGILGNEEFIEEATSEILKAINNLEFTDQEQNVKHDDRQEVRLETILAFCLTLVVNYTYSVKKLESEEIKQNLFKLSEFLIKRIDMLFTQRSLVTGLQIIQRINALSVISKRDNQQYFKQTQETLCDYFKKGIQDYKTYILRGQSLLSLMLVLNILTQTIEDNHDMKIIVIHDEIANCLLSIKNEFLLKQMYEYLQAVIQSNIEEPVKQKARKGVLITKELLTRQNSHQPNARPSLDIQEDFVYNTLEKASLKALQCDPGIFPCYSAAVKSPLPYPSIGTQIIKYVNFNLHKQLKEYFEKLKSIQDQIRK